MGAIINYRGNISTKVVQNTEVKTARSRQLENRNPRNSLWSFQTTVYAE